MVKVVKVRDMKVGEGIPKVCVSLIGKSIPDLKQEAVSLREMEVDIVEWRIDFFDQMENRDSVHTALKEIRATIGNIPLLFTFRSANEGGEKQITTDTYFSLNKDAIDSGYIDLIDLELFQEEERVKWLVNIAKEHDIAVVISNHDFIKTPSKKEIVSRMQKAVDFGADIPKIAVMPQSKKDVLTLLEATMEMNEVFECPIITMSMGGTGSLSRLSGELFGSAVTFGAAKKASAPGQIAVKELKNILQVIHQNL